MQKKEKIMVLMALCLLSIIPFMSATVTLVKPVTGYNATSTIIFNCTQTDLQYVKNASLAYNATGGLAGSILSTSIVTNDTLNDTYFYSASASVASLADAQNYNVSCRVCNDSDCAYSVARNITIDNTNPALTLTSSVSELELNGLLKLTWSVSDATSGLSSSSLNLTSPNSGLCPMQNWSATSGSDVTIDPTTLTCPGTWTLSLVGTDYSGNTNTATQSIILDVGRSAAASSAASSASVSAESGYLTGNAKGNLDTRNVAIFVAIVLIAYLIIKNK